MGAEESKVLQSESSDGLKNLVQIGSQKDKIYGDIKLMKDSNTNVVYAQQSQIIQSGQTGTLDELKAHYKAH
jgi:CRISPR/Cas system-associated protein Csx1